MGKVVRRRTRHTRRAPGVDREALRERVLQQLAVAPGGALDAPEELLPAQPVAHLGRSSPVADMIALLSLSSERWQSLQVLVSVLRAV